ncbi:MAG TPA: carboxyl transferase domain-containing protein [Acidimicrobiales bacterium]|nr:carboxyl transferase domain-containing protein [Acidimicrobiales bacterium]
MLLNTDGLVAVSAPASGTITILEVAVGDVVAPGRSLVVVESMKMEFVAKAPVGGVLHRVVVAVGDNVQEGEPIAFVEEGEATEVAAHGDEPTDAGSIRHDLAQVLARRTATLDEARPGAVARRRAIGHRTARENIEALCEPGSFVEYGQLVVAGQRRRRSMEQLVQISPADGLVGGLGRVNADRFGDERSRCILMSYDYTVFAGTQGTRNHLKCDRLFELAGEWRLPIVFFTEGGGGRPGDTEGGSGEVVPTFYLFGRLSGLVPLVGVNSGRCFAGNASLLGCCDVIIATADSSIGMGGPAMVEGGGLGVFAPEEIGPMEVQVPNGVVDIAVDDDVEAVAVAKRYLSYFQGRLEDWACADQQELRQAVPENRLRAYDVRRVITTMADTDSVLELRAGFGHGMVTALVRVEGRPLGVVANNPEHLGGAIDSPGADKATRFMQLCDTFDIPILFLCDTPGIMVGPEVEKTALVRHAARMFVAGANLTVPIFTIVLRKSYGLGALAMCGGGNKVPMLNVAWPTGEFGGMGLEGAVRLGYRKELEAIADPDERQARFDEMVAQLYEHGKALEQASNYVIDDVIDPADSRTWLSGALRSLPEPAPRLVKKRPFLDAW